MAARRFHVGRNRGETRGARVCDVRDEPVPIHAAVPPTATRERSGAGDRRPHSGPHKVREKNQTEYSKGLLNAVLRAVSRRGAGGSPSDPRAPGLQRGEADPASLTKDF